MTRKSLEDSATDRFWEDLDLKPIEQQIRSVQDRMLSNGCSVLHHPKAQRWMFKNSATIRAHFIS